MSDTIIESTLFNATNIRYTAPKVNASGGKAIKVMDKISKSYLKLSMPLMLTWGAADFVNESGVGNGKFEMALQFPSEEYRTDDTSATLKNMIEFENKIKADALIYSKEWFGKVHKSADVVDALFTPMLKYRKDKATKEPDMTSSPTLMVKLPTWEGVWKSEIYDEEGCKLFPDPSNPSVTPLDYLKKGTTVATLIQCGGLWFANGKFGCTWQLMQAVVQKPRETLSGKCFIKLKSADKEKLKAAPTPNDEDVEDEPTTLVDDSDDEAEVKVPAPVPAKVPVVEHVFKAPEPAPAPVVVEEPVATAVVAEPAVVKKKIIKKKAAGDA